MGDVPIYGSQLSFLTCGGVAIQNDATEINAPVAVD
jgi:hypothetical protein